MSKISEGQSFVINDDKSFQFSGQETGGDTFNTRTDNADVFLYNSEYNIGSEDSIEFRCTEFYDVGGMVSGLVVRKSRII